MTWGLGAHGQGPPTTEYHVLTQQIVGLLAIEAVEEPGLVTSAWIDEQLAGTDEGGDH